MKIFFIPFNKKLLMIIGIIILVIILLFSISSKVLTAFKPIYQAETGRDEIALTCNVVWGTEYIPMMLDILKKEDVKMTFYIGGKWAEDNPEVLKEIYLAGHEIGNHGYDHKKHSKLTDIDNENEIINAEKAIEKIIDEKTTLFAPPYGDINERTVEIAEDLGYKVIMWNKDTIDWRDQDPKSYMIGYLKPIKGWHSINAPNRGNSKSPSCNNKGYKETECKDCKSFRSH